MIDSNRLFGQLVKNDLKIQEKLRKIATCQEDYQAVGYLLDYPYFKQNYRLIAIELSKQQALENDPKEIYIVQEIQ